MSQEDKKPEKWSITVRVDGHPSLQMLVLPTTKVKKLIDAFCSRTGLKPALVRFINEDGEQVDADKSIEANGFENGDTMEGRIQQHGGSSC